MLSLLARIYALGMRLRNAAYDRGFFRARRVGVPVVAVGNISAGGTGKTPVVEYLLERCFADGRRPAVVTRGYRRRSRGLVVVSDGNGHIVSAAESGDEPAQIARKFPAAVVVADADRVRGARHAVQAFGADVVILDDAFQHRAIARDSNIVVFDARQDPADLRVLPAGRLRETLDGLGRADLLLLTRCADAGDGAARAKQLSSWSSAPAVLTRFRVRHWRRLITADGAAASGERADASLPPPELAGRRVLAFCGIGAPDSFRALLTDAGLDVAGFHVFADHHWYTAKDVRMLQDAARAEGAEVFVTTEKDAMRLRGPIGETCYPVLALEVMAGEEALREELRRALVSG